jgi:UDP-N-acetylglucosamine 2-epimerase (non-hydrolysing)
MTKSPPYRVDCIVGARPNFVKIAPIIRALSKRDDIVGRLIHTGQHYDVAMNAVFFEELDIPAPDINLEIGSGTGTEQTARVMLGLEPVLSERRPDVLLVVGDVNSTVAAALVAARHQIPLAHVEAGLRSGDRTMPEEINRLVTDRLSDILFTTECAAIDNLIREGVNPARVSFVGNVMIDSLRACLERAVPAGDTIEWLTPSPSVMRRTREKGFVLVTLHRPANVDDPENLKALLGALVEISREVPLVFPMHPRTHAMVTRLGLDAIMRDTNIIVAPPLSYLRAIGLMREARFVITDSGGVQEETTALGTPCLTVRENTERPITITQGTNVLVGTSSIALVAAARDVLANGGKKGRIPELWDGYAAERIIKVIVAYMRAGCVSPD